MKKPPKPNLEVVYLPTDSLHANPVYAQVCIERWQNFTKKLAKREDGAILSDLAIPAKRKTRK